MKTTLQKIRKCNPCGINRKETPATGWWQLLDGLGKTQADDEPLSIVTILEITGIDDALWCLRADDSGGYAVQRMAGDCTTANGLAFSPDDRSMYWADTPAHRIDRFAFYDRAQAAFAVVMTSEMAKYGNILLKKGVTPPFVG